MYFPLSKQSLTAVAFTGFAALLVYLSSVPVDLNLQYFIAWSLVALLLLTGRWPRAGWPRLVFLSIAVFIVFRYLSWRTFFTLGYHDPFSFIGAVALYLAELYGIAMFLMGLFVNVRPILRTPARLPLSAEHYPSVDVLIPTYDEDVSLVKVTLVAATSIAYPRDKLNVYLLDDGGTDEKLASADFNQARAALERREQLMRLCRDTGAHYLTRADNRKAKGGNLNAALPRIGGDLILILDADHVPTEDILRKTVGFFHLDPKLFLVQTPHFFVIPDPIEKNLDLFNRMPGENAMFFGAVHPGLDFWGASFFCGSAALILRKALDEAGGFSADSITEDAETALKLHGLGWRSVYVNEPLISGLQPGTFSSFLTQRIRWAQGMVQILLMHNPLRGQGLKLWQRLCYLSTMMFWLFPFPRVIFLVAPVLYILLDLHIYDANLPEVIGYSLPYLVALSASSSYLFGRFRWFLVSDIYETMQSLFSLRAVVATLRNPGSPRFRVTPKQEQHDDDFISPMSAPFYGLTGLLLITAVFGAWRLSVDSGERELLVVAMLWLGVNLVTLLASLGALYERRQRRSSPRLPVNYGAQLSFGDATYPVQLMNMSMGGANAVVQAHGLEQPAIRLLEKLADQEIGEMRVTDQRRGLALPLAVSLASCREESGRLILGLRFPPSGIESYRRLVGLVYGDSERLARMFVHKQQNPGFVREILFLLAIGFSHALAHFALLAGKPAEGSRLGTAIIKSTP